VGQLGQGFRDEIAVRYRCYARECLQIAQQAPDEADRARRIYNMSRGEMVWRVLLTTVLLTTLSAIVIVQSNADEKKNDGKIAFIVEQEFDHWRVSKLIGVGVFDPQGEKIGSVSEVLVDHSGLARVAVIDVGGFLGIGRKSVGVSFDALKWVSHEDMGPRTYNGPANRSPNLEFLKLAARPTTDASSGYPDHAILGLTSTQLKTAPDFHYARATLLTNQTLLNTPAGAAAPE
jgi:sporulation protein YlmC with PRC-barrel domain